MYRLLNNKDYDLIVFEIGFHVSPDFEHSHFHYRVWINYNEYECALVSQELLQEASIDFESCIEEPKVGVS